MIKRISLFLFFFICVYFLFLPYPLQALSPTNANFTDLDQGAWYMSSISRLYQLGGIRGYEDNTFRPNATMNRAEFIALLLASTGYRQEASENHWFENYYMLAIDFDIIDFDNYWDPFESISRVEMAEILCRFLNLPTEESKTIIFHDYSDGGVELKYMDTVYRYNLIKGYQEGPWRWFRPSYSLTRAEASTVIIHAYDYKNDPEGFMAGISHSSTQFENEVFYDFKTNIIGKNSSLFSITKVDSRRNEDAFRILLKLEFDRDEEGELILKQNHFLRQMKEVEEILLQKFSKIEVEELSTHILKKENQSTVLPEKEIESSIDHRYKASTESSRGSFFVLVTIWKSIEEGSKI
jgi:hypothetical protein